MTMFRTADRCADHGGAYWIYVRPLAPGWCLARHEASGIVKRVRNDALVKLEPCSGCGVPVEPYAPCGSEQCRVTE